MTLMPTKEELCELFAYDEQSGILYWKPRAGRSMNSWNAKNAGNPALNQNFKGYRRGGLLKRATLAHRVIWKMHFGDEPPEIDHINGNRSDNRLSNLRAVDRSQNQRNSSLRKDNSSGVVGVYWYAKYGKWLAKIGNEHIGYFSDFGDAVRHRAAVAKERGFHDNHGKLPGVSA